MQFSAAAKSSAGRIKMVHIEYDTQTRFVKFDVRKCKRCWNCYIKCPKVINRAIFDVVISNADECSGCLQCVKVCPTGAFSCI